MLVSGRLHLELISRITTGTFGRRGTQTCRCKYYYFSQSAGVTYGVFLPISTNLSTRQVMVNSLRCAGPDSWVTVYSGRRHPFCTTNSWQTSAQTSRKQTKPGRYERSSYKHIYSWFYFTCRAPTGLHSDCCEVPETFISDCELSTGGEIREN